MALVEVGGTKTDAAIWNLHSFLWPVKSIPSVGSMDFILDLPNTNRWSMMIHPMRQLDQPFGSLYPTLLYNKSLNPYLMLRRFLASLLRNFMTLS
mmetsp:Transcript_95723/g.275857  ORF Transcript_95723/g.275857 Transcript_95723/m.275857 type:complete len:95 (-) Transcript_95723:83-367(-)